MPKFDEAGLHRSVHPGAGSRTPYHNGTTYVSRRIPAGGELFKDYGQNWFDFRYSIFGDFPMNEHYDSAGELLEEFMELKVGKDGDDSKKDEVLADLYQVLKTLKPDHPSRTGFKSPWEAKKKTAFRSRVLNALPDDYADAKRAVEEFEGDLTELHQPAATHSLEFLYEKGKCFDHITSGRSTVDGAGLGAFATRNLPKDTVVTASPLHHISKSFPVMYKFRKDPATGRAVKTNEIAGYQLMMNYCYSHSNSSFLFCPYGAGINYINHNREKANLRIQWAKDFSIVHNQTAVEVGTLEDLNLTERPQLAFDYVATKDIKKGDELFLGEG